ncbi:hypothetical protein Tco_1164010 [Tanacetum coccineum]
MSKLLYTRFTKLIIDYLLSLNKSIPRRSDSKLHSLQDDHPIAKLLNTTNGDYKFGMEVPNAMTSDEIKKKAGYKYYMAKKVESEKAKIVYEPEEQHVSPVKSGRGKGFMCYGDQVANVPNKLKKDVMPRKTRSLTIAEEVVSRIEIYQLDEFLRQKKQTLKGRSECWLTNKNYSSSDNRSDATLYSSCSDKPEGSANETNDADESYMDLSDYNPYGDDDDARYGVFMHNKSTATPNSTYLSPTVTSSSLDFIRALLNETPANELTEFMSHPVYPQCSTSKRQSHKKFKEYDQKLEALTNFNVSEAFEKAIQAKFLAEIKKLLPTHFPNVISNYVKPHLNTSVPESNDTHTTHQQLYDTLYESIILDQDALDAQDEEPSFHKRSHDNQDPLNNREEENKKKHQKDVGEPSSRSSRRNISPLDENHILGPSTVALAKKFKEPIQKDELRIADLEVAVLSEAQWNSDEGDVSKPRSFERHMSKSTKPHPCFYNNKYTYLVDLNIEEKYTTSIIKPLVSENYKYGIEDRIPERWIKEVRRYHFEALNDLRIKSVVRIDVKKKWGYGFLTSIVVRISDDKE